eukprot:47771-Eustigmatos_ZCMA.PRE.1
MCAKAYNTLDAWVADASGRRIAGVAASVCLTMNHPEKLDLSLRFALPKGLPFTVSIAFGSCDGVEK